MAGEDDEPALVYVIGRVNQGIRREMKGRLSEKGLTIPEYTALSVLRSRPGLSNAQLSRRSMIMPQSMLEVLASLEERGLVRREVDPDHGRILRAELTDEGHAALERADPAIQAMEDAMLAGVPARQRATVLKALISVMGRLTQGLD